MDNRTLPTIRITNSVAVARLLKQRGSKWTPKYAVQEQMKLEKANQMNAKPQKQPVKSNPISSNSNQKGKLKSPMQ